MKTNYSLQSLTREELIGINGGGRLWDRVKELLAQHKSVGYITAYILEYVSQGYQDEVMSDIESGDIWTGYP